MEQHNRDWSYDEFGDDADIEYQTFDKEVGRLAYACLDQLSVPLATLDSDTHGWTHADRAAWGMVYEVDWLGRLMVPPTGTPLENRIQFDKLMASLRTALPFTEAEREWLLEDAASYHSLREGDFDVVRGSEARLVSVGLSRVVHARDILQRWWSWRREVGDYADQGGLDQARHALAGLVQLLTPDLGLPESYEGLR